MDNKELTAFLKAYASGLITLPDGMMEAEAAPDPDDEDMEGMEDGEDEGSTYDAVVILDDTGGKYVNFKLEFPKRKDGVHGKK